MGSGKTVHLRPRHYRLYTDPAVEEAEANFRYAELDWSVPLSEAAVICLDVWNYHFARDTLERTDAVTREKILPVVRACRQAGLQVIHAPAAPVATKHPNWVRLVDADAKPTPPWPDSPAWPPEEFVAKRGPYAKYARPHEPQRDVRDKHRQEQRDFHPAVRPEGDEAVVLNGEELHRLCAQRGILHLLYVGFHTNMCIVQRDYGTYAMMQRGYHAILVRDCTTGMETHETQRDMMCTRGTVATLEQLAYTMTGAELIGALGGNDE